MGFFTIFLSDFIQYILALVVFATTHERKFRIL